MAYKIGSKDMILLMMTYESPEGVDHIVNETMRSQDVIKLEIDRAADGNYLKQPLIFSDYRIIVPWDLLNSCIFKM